MSIPVEFIFSLHAGFTGLSREGSKTEGGGGEYEHPPAEKQVKM